MWSVRLASVLSLCPFPHEDASLSCDVIAIILVAFLIIRAPSNIFFLFCSIPPEQIDIISRQDRTRLCARRYKLIVVCHCASRCRPLQVRCPSASMPQVRDMIFSLSPLARLDEMHPTLAKFNIPAKGQERGGLAVAGGGASKSADVAGLSTAGLSLSKAFETIEARKDKLNVRSALTKSYDDM